MSTETVQQNDNDVHQDKLTAAEELPQAPASGQSNGAPLGEASESYRATLDALPRQPPAHALLADENAKDIILRFHLQRSFLKRAVEQCVANGGVYLPPMLVEALRCVLVDDIPPAAVFPQSGQSSTTQEVVSGLQRSVEATTISRQKQELSVMLQNASSSSLAPPRPGSPGHRGGGAMTSLDVTEVSIASHIDLSQHAITHHPSHAASIIREAQAVEEERQLTAAGIVPPPRMSKSDYVAPKKIIDDAFQARRAGDRRREIEILVDYLHRGREGRVSLDTATTMRVLRSVGDAHSALHEHVAAEQYYFDWYMIAEKVGLNSEAARALTMLGDCAHVRGDLKAAEEWLSKARWRITNGQ
ncbi:Hypothetical protein, putative [Bodo saltans]|uniref:Uncharacterized protein n=1 Tax=Bodo saltans TaxID=75058 RepID=A0A0S4IQI7_BODSA|nr:Hypothetical protein, putative [Bodo saltans]|eukprot:CUF26786.1 Hypothetical protein, putative [Bodo saltans]